MILVLSMKFQSGSIFVKCLRYLVAFVTVVASVLELMVGEVLEPLMVALPGRSTGPILPPSGI